MSVQALGTGSFRGGSGRGGKNMRETIHSGHFMVSDFEPESEAQDEEYEVGMPIPPGPPETVVVKAPEVLPTHQQPNSSRAIINSGGGAEGSGSGGSSALVRARDSSRRAVFEEDGQTAISIDGSLTKLFQCMSLAYRQKLTSPKWNRFKGVRLRWKDKIRLNNVIWRCWHMQFIMKKKTFVCQFASPLDVDGHNKPEAVVMEGKYWKRKLSTVAAEYKKWRLFYRNRIMGWSHATPITDIHPVTLDGFDWSRSGTYGTMSNIIFDDDMFMDFTDTLFSSLSSNQPFQFPNPREIARAGMVADFIQPGLIQLQPNLDDFMDTLEPLHDYVNSKFLPPVPEELENFETPDSLLPHHVLAHHGKQQQQQQFYDQNLVLSTSSNQGQKEDPHKNDVFAKPQGKPRGRSRSGGRVGQGISNGGPNPNHSQQMVNNANSNSLLSHLLGQNSSNPPPPPTTNSSGEYHPLNMISYHGHHHQQQQQQQGPPPPFVLPPQNGPLVINFTGGGMSKGNISPPGGHNLAVNGNNSPPLLGGHHSPPIIKFDAPPSPSKGARKSEYKEHRRVCHINAEQKRRCNIKNGFDTLHALIPQLSHNPNAKVSKAAMLAKGAEYIRQLKVERSQLKDEIESHRAEVEALNAAINNCQSLLPATGAPVSRQRTNKMNEMFHAWVRHRTLENWKFWLFSTLIRPLLDSYNNAVSTASVEEMCRTVLAWVDQHCSLVDLRPAVLSSLRQLCTTTDILSNPAKLEEEAYKAVNRPLNPAPSPPDNHNSHR